MEKITERINETEITLDGSTVSNDQLNIEKESLNNDERIVEVSPGKYEKLTRMQG